MATKFLYIDDEPQTAKGIIKPIEDEYLSFDVQKPMTWNEQKAYLIDSKELNKFDGLLLDLKLEFSNGDSNDVKFSGPDLAQTIRSDVKAGKIKDLPIFLCSTDENFMTFFDRTSYDLFDKKYTKNKDLHTEFIKNEFICFALAYKSVATNYSIENLMQNGPNRNEELVALQAELKGFKTSHEFINFINRNVIHSSGILIDEELLAIRLGIDFKNSDEWKILKDNFLEVHKYKGILSNCYERWWQADILKWWKETIGKSLKVMSAQEKVTALIEKIGVKNIKYLSLPEHHRFDTFWYKCRLSNTHLDPSDALRTIEMPRYIWQEPNYISLSYIKSDDRDRNDIISLLGANEMKIFNNF